METTIGIQEMEWNRGKLWEFWRWSGLFVARHVDQDAKKNVGKVVNFKIRKFSVSS